MGIKTYQEKNTKPMKKELAQSDIPVMRKITKTTQNITFLKTVFFGTGRPGKKCVSSKSAPNHRVMCPKVISPQKVVKMR